MRSLSLESILVNKNMKLLILLVTLLVQTNPSLSMPTTSGLKVIFHEILENLKDLKEELSLHDLKEFKHAVQIQTPHDIENACECEAAFVQHLKAALKSVKEILHTAETEDPMEIIQNILDNLNNHQLHKIKKSNDSCSFMKHKIELRALSNVLIKKNTEFIQNWNHNC